MLSLTYLLSPSLDIVVKVAPRSVRLAEGLHITREEMDWSFMGCGAALHQLRGVNKEMRRTAEPRH